MSRVKTLTIASNKNSLTLAEGKKKKEGGMDSALLHLDTEMLSSEISVS